MKKLFFTLISISFATSAFAQTAVDAYQLSPSDLRGTARFMSMGGAFTALGGDISRLNQNPAGIGIYRKSEIGFSLDINMTSSDLQTPSGTFNDSKTHTFCNNFGYVGAISLDNEILKNFNWGVSYTRAASFNRSYRMGREGNYVTITNSLSNYIASFTSGSPANLTDTDYPDKFNPYFDGNADWLSILAYQGRIISYNGNNGYRGLWNNNTRGDMYNIVRERGYVDEYSIDFGGNLSDIVYWGVGFGITDIKFSQFYVYDEQLINASVPVGELGSAAGGSAYGEGGYTLESHKLITGSGFNFKTGVIVKPINELRLGIAVHTPTYYKLTQEFKGYLDYGFDYDAGGYIEGNQETEFGFFDWKLQTPWKLMVGAAGVIGGRGIISADYEYAAYDKMEISDRADYYDYTAENEEIQTYYKPQHTVRLGAEFRVTPEFSVRAGYNIQKSAVEQEAYDGYKSTGESYEIITGGLNTSYSFDNKTDYITLGLGYRYKAFYIDMAYVHKTRESAYHTYTNYNNVNTYKYKLTTKEDNIVLTAGFKF